MKSLLTVMCMVIFLFGTSINGFGQRNDQGVVDDVIKLTKAKVADDIILAKFENIKIELSVNQILQLKNAGVSDNVVRAIIGTTGKSETKKEPSQQLHSSIAQGVDIEEVGVYFNDNGKSLMLTPRTFVEQKGDLMGGIKRLATLKGVGTDIKGVLMGRSSPIRVSTKPEFIFNVPEGIVPSEYTLVKLDQKKSQREITFAKLMPSLMGGRTKAHFPQKAIKSFSIRRISPRKYEITIEATLERGEYAFCPAAQTQFGVQGATNTGMRVYDFGVD